MVAVRWALTHGNPVPSGYHLQALLRATLLAEAGVPASPLLNMGDGEKVRSAGDFCNLGLVQEGRLSFSATFPLAASGGSRHVSHARHYDYGMRAVFAVLVQAGRSPASESLPFWEDMGGHGAISSYMFSRSSKLYALSNCSTCYL